MELLKAGESFNFMEKLKFSISYDGTKEKLLKNGKFIFCIFVKFVSKAAEENRKTFVRLRAIQNIYAFKGTSANFSHAFQGFSVCFFSI